MIVKNIIFCEDIRQEIGNKISIMGALGSNINIKLNKDFPPDTSIQIDLAAVISIEKSPEDSDKFEVKTNIFAGDKNLLVINGKVESSPLDTKFNLPVPKINYPAIGSETIKVVVEVFSEGNKIADGSTSINVNILR